MNLICLLEAGENAPLSIELHKPRLAKLIREYRQMERILAGQSAAVCILWADQCATALTPGFHDGDVRPELSRFSVMLQILWRS